MLGQPVSGLTHQALAQLLVDRGVYEGLVETVKSYITTTERVRFAPRSAEYASGESVLDETARLLADLDGYFA
jgi:sirohydrochlorin ferrochelatase